MNDLLCYKTLPQWNSATLPATFQQQHNTQAGTWARLTLLSGTLTFALMTQEGETTETWQFSPESQPPFIEPQQWHRIVSFSDDMICQLAFYCSPEDYYAKKYELTRTHSEVIEAARQIAPGKTLDLGCGGGRNSLYLNLKGFDVTAWFALYAPRNTPAPVVQQLIDAARSGLQSQAIATNFATMGAKPGTLFGADLAAFESAERKKWGGLIKDKGITAQ